MQGSLSVGLTRTPDLQRQILCCDWQSWQEMVTFSTFSCSRAGRCARLMRPMCARGGSMLGSVPCSCSLTRGGQTSSRAWTKPLHAAPVHEGHRPRRRRHAAGVRCCQQGGAMARHAAWAAWQRRAQTPRRARRWNEAAYSCAAALGALLPCPRSQLRGGQAAGRVPPGARIPQTTSHAACWLPLFLRRPSLPGLPAAAHSESACVAAQAAVPRPRLLPQNPQMHQLAAQRALRLAGACGAPLLPPLPRLAVWVAPSLRAAGCAARLPCRGPQGVHSRA